MNNGKYKPRVSAKLCGAVAAFDQKEADALAAVKTLIEWTLEDPAREGLSGTPRRVIKTLKEMTSGYHEDPKRILSTTFSESSDEVIILQGIEFTSLCEHHLLPFLGTADVGYLPGKVVGLSKLARLVDCFSKRLQIQERLTSEIAKALMTHLKARGAATVIRAKHLCMGCRGVKKPSATMITSCMLGVFRTNSPARAEFLTLCGSSTS